MVIIQALILTILLIVFCRKWMMKHPLACRMTALVLSLSTIAGVWSGLFSDLPGWMDYVLPLLTQGALAGAMFMAVMYAAAVKNGSPVMRAIMPIRAELSIDACILTLGHNIAFGKTYFIRLFDGSTMPWNIRAAAICSLMMIFIMLPLFITSFKAVRRKMNGRSWKKLQRAAYCFYALMYVHIMLLNFVSAWGGKIAACINVIVYSAVFLSYAALRIRKALLKNKPRIARALPLIASTLMACVLVFLFLPLRSQVPATAVSVYTDGVYTGSGNGYNGRITVSVTVEKGVITAIELISSDDDEPYLSDALKGVIPAVLEVQSAAVDVTTSATYSTEGLLDGIAKALSQAEADL